MWEGLSPKISFMCNHPSKSPKYFQEKKKKSFEVQPGQGSWVPGQGSKCLSGRIVSCHRVQAVCKFQGALHSTVRKTEEADWCSCDKTHSTPVCNLRNGRCHSQLLYTSGSLRCSLFSRCMPWQPQHSSGFTSHYITFQQTWTGHFISALRFSALAHVFLI